MIDPETRIASFRAGLLGQDMPPGGDEDAIKAATAALHDAEKKTRDVVDVVYRAAPTTDVTTHLPLAVFGILFRDGGVAISQLWDSLDEVYQESATIPLPDDLLEDIAAMRAKHK
jgi:hypothetical protein